MHDLSLMLNKKDQRSNFTPVKLCSLFKVLLPNIQYPLSTLSKIIMNINHINLKICYELYLFFFHPDCLSQKNMTFSWDKIVTYNKINHNGINCQRAFDLSLYLIVR